MPDVKLNIDSIKSLAGYKSLARFFGVSVCITIGASAERVQIGNIYLV